MINTTSKCKFLTILLFYTLLHTTNVMLGMEDLNEKSTILYIQCIDTPGKHCTIPEVELKFKSSKDFVESSNDVYAKIYINRDTNKTPFLLYLYHNGSMLYKKMLLTTTQMTEIVKQQKNNSPIFIHGSIPKYTMINDKKMQFTDEIKLFKLNFSPITTLQSSLYQNEIIKLEQELLKDNKELEQFNKIINFEKMLLDEIITLEQKLQKFETEDQKNEQEIITLEQQKFETEDQKNKQEIVTLEQQLQTIEKENETLKKNQSSIFSKISYFTGGMALIITCILVLYKYDKLLPLLEKSSFFLSQIPSKISAKISDFSTLKSMIFTFNKKV